VRYEALCDILDEDIIRHGEKDVIAGAAVPEASDSLFVGGVALHEMELGEPLLVDNVRAL
jgi:hypothetical protein